MKKLNEYLDSLTNDELVNAYRDEYLVFINTGICPDGVIRNIAELANSVIGHYHIDFAKELFLSECAKKFYEQNRKS